MRLSDMTASGFDLRRLRTEAEEWAATAREVHRGLLARPLPWIPPKYFYDDRGGELFERITHLPEYYLTRTEEEILRRVGAEVIEKAAPRHLVELGSGAGVKVQLLLDAMARRGELESATLLDVSEAALVASLEQLAVSYPGVRLDGVVGDFLADLPALGRGERRLVAFLGSTIGNLHPDEVPPFLRAVRESLDGSGALLLGLDLVKDERILHAAYNDAAGVTAEFNRNMLRVLNLRLGADFDPDGFDHVAFFDPKASWIEMRLRCREGAHVHVPGADLALDLRAGDEIRTEISCKYSRPMLEQRLAGTGLRLAEWYTDAEEWFALALLRPLAVDRD